MSDGWGISCKIALTWMLWNVHEDKSISVQVLACPGGGTSYVMGDTYVPRFWPPFFTLAGSSTIFLGYFSHPPTAKLSFGVQKLPIFTKIDLFDPKFNFFLDLFGSNFQRPAAHPHQFSGRVPPPGLLGAVRQQASTWSKIDPDLCHHMVSLGHIELRYTDMHCY